MELRDWSVDANDAISLVLHDPLSGQEADPKFHPSYTYPLFGESESIFGYKDLRIALRFAADDMTPCLDHSYSAKVPQSGDVEADDVNQIFRDYLPPTAFSYDSERFLHTIQLHAETRSRGFIPPGALLHTYLLDDISYEIWYSSLMDPRCRELVRNIQVLIPFFIEGGTALDLADEDWTNCRWDVFFLYRKLAANRYSFIGYCTVYRHFYFHKSDIGLCRARISQFIVLPPHQKRGLGSLFYDNVISHYMNDGNVREITVEDPNEAFSDLRDIQDLARLQNDHDFNAITLLEVAQKQNEIEVLRKRAKMPTRQFRRISELHLLSKLDCRDKRSYKTYRLLVKSRIYKQNIDVLGQLDRPERLDKLQETYLHVEDDNRRLLSIITTRHQGSRPQSVRLDEHPKKRVKLAD